MRKVMFLVVVALVLAGGATFSANYEDWVVNPKLIAQKRAHVVQQLRDPATVQFKDERLTKQGWLCGELNGQNAYGAYVGFKRFASLADDRAWIDGSGYAGKPGAQSTAQIIQGLDAQIAASERLLKSRKENPDLPVPSKQEIQDAAAREVFAEIWQKYCT